MQTPLQFAWHLMGKLETLLPDLKGNNTSDIVRMLQHETERRDAGLTAAPPVDWSKVKISGHTLCRKCGTIHAPGLACPTKAQPIDAHEFRAPDSVQGKVNDVEAVIDLKAKLYAQVPEDGFIQQTADGRLFVATRNRQLVPVYPLQPTDVVAIHRPDGTGYWGNPSSLA